MPPLNARKIAAMQTLESENAPDSYSYAPGARLGKYVVRKFLGGGAMGRVYQADHSLLDCSVAIKVLHSEYCDNETILQRFIDEARMLAILKSPHTVRVLDAEISGSHAFLVMEYVDGTHLGKYIDRYGYYDLPTLLDLARQVALALAEAHEHGIVHRDIKPDNILLTRDDSGDLLAKVADFGVAKRRHIDQTRTTLNGAVLGTPCYMAPEQYYTPGEVDPRADIFALGVLIYEMCSGSLPFVGDDINQIMLSVTTSQPIPLHQLNPTVPIEVSRLVSACLEPDREKRLKSAQIVADRLKTVLDVIQPTSMRRPRLATANTELGDSRAPAVLTLPLVEKKARSGSWLIGLPAAAAVAAALFSLQGNVQLPQAAQDLKAQGAQKLNLALTPDTLSLSQPSLEPRQIAFYHVAPLSEVVAPADVELLEVDESGYSDPFKPATRQYNPNNTVREAPQRSVIKAQDQSEFKVEQASTGSLSNGSLSNGTFSKGNRATASEPQIALAALDPIEP